MNEKDFYYGRFVWMTVIACLLAVLVFIPGIDSVGRMIIGSMAGLLMLRGLWNLRASRRAVSEAMIYTPMTLHNAPLALQIRFTKRSRWIVCGATLILTILTAWDFHQLETGAVASIHVTAPFDWIYERWGSGVALSTMLFCGLAGYGIVELRLGMLLKQAKTQAEAEAPQSS